MRWTLALALLLSGCTTSTRSGGPSPPHLEVETTKGTFVVEMRPHDAPRTVEHILDLARSGFYDGIPFHRYEPGFVIQGGDPLCRNEGWVRPETSGCGTGGSGSPVPLEAGNATHEYGAVGLARAEDPNSGDSQFYVVISREGAFWLDGSYTVFGKVVSGMDRVERLRVGDLMVKVRVLE